MKWKLIFFMCKLGRRIWNKTSSRRRERGGEKWERLFGVWN